MRIVIPITSKSSALRIPLTVTLQRTPLNNLTSVSYALVVHLRALDPARIIRPIGCLDVNDLASVEASLRTLLGL
ncbi:MAG: type II toxin-antitoxin system PemK/MazF family toxin [Spirochaetales bacterium]|nr:type II toxin-antitoxin system PemK/MazF family toxin [Spirochaetales bacterium]